MRRLFPLFEVGEDKYIVGKIIDERDIESLKIVEIRRTEN